MDNLYYPPAGIFFSVTGILPEEESIGFQSVAGLTVEMSTESYREGGQNEFEYKLPVRAQYPDLVLKRGLWTSSKQDPIDLRSWCLQRMRTLVVEPKDITIILKSPANTPLMVWKVIRARPKKWSIGDFNAEDNQIAIETIEMIYDYFELTIPGNSSTIQQNA